jgi:hypothetical protein
VPEPQFEEDRDRPWALKSEFEEGMDKRLERQFEEGKDRPWVL